MTVQAWPWVGFWPSRTADQTSTTTLECTAPLLCHAKPILKHSCIPYCTKFSRIFKFANFVNFQSFTKMYRQNFLRASKGMPRPTDAAIISKKCSKIAICKELDCWKFCTVQYVLAMMGLVSSLSTQYTKYYYYDVSRCTNLIYMLSKSRYYFFVMLWA